MSNRQGQQRSAGEGGRKEAASSASSVQANSTANSVAAAGGTEQQRRQPPVFPGLSSTASSVRRQSSNLAPNKTSSARRLSGGRSSFSDRNDIDGLDDDSLHANVDPEQLDELRAGIIMPGLGGARANVDAQKQIRPSLSDPTTPAVEDPNVKGKGVTFNTTTATGPARGTTTQPAYSALGSRNDTATNARPAALRSMTAGADLPPPPSRSRAQPTLKASMLKKRMAAPKSSSTKSNPTQAKMGQGTPARATRYSLPVRAEKPVRTSKTTGKHVVLPSESQLAPLPGEEDEDDDDDDDDEDDDQSSEDEPSDIELSTHADDEFVQDLDEEEREKAREAVRVRREEAQRKLEEVRKEKEARRQARKPKSAPGYPGGLSGETIAPAKTGYPGYRGPAHARAPPRVPKSTGPVYHTFERLAPAVRVHTPLPRLTSYAVAPSIHIPSLIGFLRREHGVRPRLYDECAYVVYFKPLLPGFGRAEVRSAPEPRHGSPGAESRREREIVEREESGYVGNYFAATNREDEGEAMDEQGYIIGGEGRGKEEEEEEQARRRRQQEKQASASAAAIAGGDVTETEAETDREGADDRRTTDLSETDGETEREQMTVDDDDTAPLLKVRSQQRLSGSMENDEELESGLQTPKALQPRRSGSTDDEDVMLDNVFEQRQRERELDDVEDAMEQEQQQQYPLSSADVAGAQDLRNQQTLIESGQEESADMPAIRSAGESDRNTYDEVNERLDRQLHDVLERSIEEEVENGGAITPSRRSASSIALQREHDDQVAMRSNGHKRRARRGQRTRTNTASHNHDCSTNILASRNILEALHVAELVILPYGVLVMYNMSAAEERSIINDVISSGCARGGLPYGVDNEEMESFHFCYDPSVPAPRIFNDFFTFRASNHLLKLSLAHAIAQSTRLSVFEESMQQTLELTSHIPKELAGTGELQLKRREALKLTGRLFKLRVDVNLTSNVLDTPELFWSEASLKALYDAIREYLEIDQRVENLNERLAVGNDLLEVIHDHLGSQSMNQITWIIIVLIVVACFVACGEIMARLVLHGRGSSAERMLRLATPEQLQEAFTALQLSLSSVPPAPATAAGAQTALRIAAD